MSETLSAQNEDYQHRKALESDLADLIEHVKRLEAARPPPQDDPLLSQEQAAAVIGVKPPTLAMWRHKGKGPRYHKVGRSASRLRIGPSGTCKMRNGSGRARKNLSDFGNILRRWS